MYYKTKIYTRDHEKSMKDRIYTWDWINRRNYCLRRVRRLLRKVAMALQVLQVKGIDRYRGSGKNLAKHLGKWLKKYILNVQVS